MVVTRNSHFARTMYTYGDAAAVPIHIYTYVMCIGTKSVRSVYGAVLYTLASDFRGGDEKDEMKKK